MPKNTPKIIAFVLLITIIALALIAGGTDGTGLFNKKNQSAISSNDEIIIEMNQELLDNNNVQPISLYDKFPKQSQFQTDSGFTQTVDVDGTIVYNNSHAIENFHILIATCNSIGGDLNTEHNTVVVFKMLENGLIEKAIRLSVDCDAVYMKSQITIFGVLIVVSGNSDCIVFNINLELDILSKTEVEYVSDFNIFSSHNLCLCILTSSVNTLFIFSGNKLEPSIVLPEGDVLDVFETENHYYVFINNDDHYLIIFLEKDLSGYTKKIITQKKLCAVMPAFNDNTLCFICVETTNNSTFVVFYSEIFDTNTSVCFFLGASNFVNTFVLSDKLLLTLETADNANLCYIINRNKLISSLPGTTFFDKYSLLDCKTYDNKIALLVKTYNTLCVVCLDNNYAVTKNTKIAENIKSSKVISLNSKTILIAYEEMYGGNLGITKLPIL
ncbi:MAG: hypothetical protein LBF68_01635 [Christensenellaceae bacterium]|jgi:hypothetical protein|nr:hypothetical protein [Christensenellaceae bacterium]